MLNLATSKHASLTVITQNGIRNFWKSFRDTNPSEEELAGLSGVFYDRNGDPKQNLFLKQLLGPGYVFDCHCFPFDDFPNGALLQLLGHKR